MDSSARMRVKVYRLSTGNEWVDQGTGHCSSEFNEDKSEGTLVVRSEVEEKEVLLSSRIRVGDDLYQRQQVWSEDDVDLALSFQEADGCSEIWDDINEVQQHYADDLFSDPTNADGVAGAGYSNTSLPKPDLSNLTEIQELVRGAHADVAERVKLAAFIVIDNYIDKLLPVLEACEDLESISDLYTLHSILLGIINLNDIAIIQYILKDDIFVGCVGILEYDPNAPDPKLDLRDILRNGSKYKQLVPIKDQDIEQKIHQVFRLQFLRDVVLTRFLDDGLSSILGSLIFFHNIDIVNYIHQHRTFLGELIGILHDDSETAERRRDVLCQTGLFSVFEFALADSDPRIRMAGVEITLSAMEHDSNLIRSHVVARAEETDQKQLFEIIVDQFLAEQDSGIMTQFAEVIRILLDMNIGLIEHGMTMTTDGSGHLDQDAGKFLEVFYSSYIHKLVSPLMAVSDVALKFLRTCVGLKDEDYNGHLIELDAFTHVMDLFLATHNRNNLVNSVCLEFFDFILTENIQSLGTHIVATSGKRLENIRFDQAKDIPSTCTDEPRHGNTTGDQTIVSLEIATNTERESRQNGMQNGHAARVSGSMDAEREDPSTSPRRRKLAEYASEEDGQDVKDRSRPNARVAVNQGVLERAEKRPRHSAPSPMDAANEGALGSLKSTSEANGGDVEPSALIEASSAAVSSEVPLSASLCMPSALPVIPPRTGILFVKAGTDTKDKSQTLYVDVGVTKAAMQLRSDLATESLRHQQQPLPTPPTPRTERAGKRRKEEEEPVRGSKSLRMEAKRGIDGCETETPFRIKDLLPNGSRIMTEPLNGSSYGVEGNGGDATLEEVTATVAEPIELPKDTATPVANIG
ncbi:Platinum sensitivity protein [Mortierella alpina]|nr:Platinum sensitivity protein [Mortierella alpina]